MIDLRLGDCVKVLKGMRDSSVEAIVTDPPYELGFMGKGWDASGIAYSVDMWSECLRVLKPGGHLLAFGGTRTYHRMACAIEDAGFEVRDSIHWVYGSGFPKSLNLKREWSGWGTALKPSFEPVVVAVKPATIGSCLSRLSARVADECSKSNPSEFVAAFASALRSVAPLPATQGVSSVATATSQYAADKALSWNTVASWQNTWAEVLGLENTSTIGTETRPTTESKTLLSCLSRLMDENTLVRESEFSSLVRLAASLFLANTHRLNATRTLAAIESATERLLEGSPARGDSGPHEPIVVARKPLIGTVAANVQAHGTGALNIDGCRVGTEGGGTRCMNRDATGQCLGHRNAGRSTSGETFHGPDTDGGRWPPNILLSHTPECGEACAEDCAVAEMDRQSPVSGTPKTYVPQVRYSDDGGMFNIGKRRGGGQVGDVGGASRFFPVFRYQAKASRKDRGLYLTCDCQTGTSPPWVNEVQNRLVKMGVTSPQRDTSAENTMAAHGCSTSSSGSGCTAQSLPVGKSTTRTATNSTTDWKTSDSSQPSNTSDFMVVVNSEGASGSSPAESAESGNPSTPTTSISQSKAGHSMGVAVPATSESLWKGKSCDVCGGTIKGEGHSTVKPVALMEWLIRLVTPPGGVVLDPFAGSGTTGVAAKKLGFNFIGIEREEAYVEIARKRIESARTTK